MGAVCRTKGVFHFVYYRNSDTGINYYIRGMKKLIRWVQSWFDPKEGVSRKNDKGEMTHFVKMRVHKI